jgi:uncharacterized protein YndB with AHSA1/START domain
MLIRAEREVDASAEAVFDFLADLENHWRLAGEGIQVLDLMGPPGARTGGRVRLRGPLGIGRVVSTAVIAAEQPERMTGSAELGRRTHATVTWTLREEAGRLHVALEARVEGVSLGDQILLALGGRRWLERLFQRTLAHLGDQSRAAGAERVDRVST